MEKREIKFRGWSRSYKKFIYYNSWFTVSKQGFLCLEESEAHSYVDDSDVDYPERIDLQQFTGLKDHKGKEIYEGDIVECFDNNRLCGMGEVKFGKFESSHDGGCSGGHYHQGFFIENNGNQIRNNISEDIDWEFVEIIGNIYENPELYNINPAGFIDN
jgi:uncharacterized phage protein (TIGR01671 family)